MIIISQIVLVGLGVFALSDLSALNTHIIGV